MWDLGSRNGNLAMDPVPPTLKNLASYHLRVPKAFKIYIPCHFGPKAGGASTWLYTPAAPGPKVVATSGSPRREAINRRHTQCRLKGPHAQQQRNAKEQKLQHSPIPYKTPPLFKESFVGVYIWNSYHPHISGSIWEQVGEMKSAS